MSFVDLVILAIFAFSALISFRRGFFREAMSLSTWLAAVLLTMLYTQQFSVLLPLDSVDNPQARSFISALILFSGALAVGKIIHWMLARLLVNRTLNTADKVLGIFFGLLRSIVVVTLLVLLSNRVPELKLENWWQESRLLPYFQAMALNVLERLPNGIAQYFLIQSPI